MKKFYLPLGLSLLLGAPALQAQTTATEANGKLDVFALKKAEEMRKNLRTGRITMQTADASQGFIIVSGNPSATAEAITEAGHRARVIDATTLTAHMPLTFAEKLAARSEVKRIHASLEAQPTLTTARKQTNVDAVHSGEGLETPFTGKGVIVGIIDIGFQYNHPAFKSATGSNRIKSVWEKDKSAPSTFIPTLGYDGRKNEDHGTHVAGIAAGSRHGDFPYYGMAPEADLIFISSGLDDANVLEGATYIKEFAEAAGQPWVINMSFGSLIGAHDGTKPYDQSMSRLTGPGGLMSAAMGNWSQGTHHVQRTFSAGDTLRAIAFEKGKDQVVLDWWGNATDSLHHFQVVPVVQNTVSGVREQKSDAFWKPILYFHTEICPYNRKEHYHVQISQANMRAALGLSGSEAEKYTFGLEVRPLTPEDAAAGNGFHAWTSHADNAAQLAKYAYHDLIGDNEYLVAEAAATIPAAVSVAAYDGATNFTAAIDGKTYGFAGKTGQLASYSDFGPFLGEDMKPTVAAPGSFIASSLNRYSDKFDLNTNTNVAAVGTTGKLVDYATATVQNSHFYGIKSGTSMAAPAVTGILALWLEANPNLTPEQVKEIIQKTAIHDNFNPIPKWNKKWGHGKIDAYAGLKEALLLAETNGIGEKLNTTEPVTLNKSAEAWRILFNNNESYADITILGIDGRTVSRKHLLQPRRGDEHTVSLNGLPAGIYLIRIATTGKVMTRRVAVK